MEKCKMVYDVLEKLDISYEILEHPPVFTTEEADKYISGKVGAQPKSLFLCNRKATAYYLVILEDKKKLDMKKLGEIINEKGMRFCSPEKLMNKLSLTPGSVSLFGLINNKEHDIKVFLDKEMLSEKTISFHPNDNTKTVFIDMNDMYKFLESVGYDYTAIEI